jgi:hypothetical protein
LNAGNSLSQFANDPAFDAQEAALNGSLGTVPDGGADNLVYDASQETGVNGFLNLVPQGIAQSFTTPGTDIMPVAGFGFGDTEGIISGAMPSSDGFNNYNWEGGTRLSSPMADAGFRESERTALPLLWEFRGSSYRGRICSTLSNKLKDWFPVIKRNLCLTTFKSFEESWT